MNHSPKVVDCIRQRALSSDEIVSAKITLEHKKSLNIQHLYENNTAFRQRTYRVYKKK